MSTENNNLPQQPPAPPQPAPPAPSAPQDAAPQAAAQQAPSYQQDPPQQAQAAPTYNQQAPAQPGPSMSDRAKVAADKAKLAADKSKIAAEKAKTKFQSDPKNRWLALGLLAGLLLGYLLTGLFGKLSPNDAYLFGPSAKSQYKHALEVCDLKGNKDYEINGKDLTATLDDTSSNLNDLNCVIGAIGLEADKFEDLGSSETGTVRFDDYIATLNMNDDDDIVFMLEGR